MVRGIGGEIPDISCKYVEIDIFDSHSDFFFINLKQKTLFLLILRLRVYIMFKEI